MSSRLLRPAVWALLGLVLLAPTASFLALAFSPALFEQGPEWLTLAPFQQALQGQTLRGLADSLLLGMVAGGGALVMATGLAWLIARTTLWGRPLWSALIWALLLMPTYFAAVGWQSLLEPKGVLAQFGVDASSLHGLVFGPVGVAWILTTKGLPFAYLTMSAALLGLGREFEDAARVHGATRWSRLRVVLPILAPGMFSAFAIVFAESIADFGVASTLAAAARFPVATYTLYQAISALPIRFPVASAVGWLLVGLVSLALVIQYRALHGRSYVVLSGRTRPVSPRPLSRAGQAAALVSVSVFFGLVLGVPIVGAGSASLLTGFGGHFAWEALTLANYQHVFASADLRDPLLLSGRLAMLVGAVAVLLGTIVGRVLVRRRSGAAGRGLDVLLLAAVALPGIVLAAGYVFAYNLPQLTAIGIRLYGTLTLLGLAYLAAALPVTTRLLVGSLAQVSGSLVEAARVHGAGEMTAWRTTVLPLLARPLVWAWLLTFAHIIFELPISQMLYPAGQMPLPVATVRLLEGYDFAGGSAIMVVAIVGVLAFSGLVLGVFRYCRRARGAGLDPSEHGPSQTGQREQALRHCRSAAAGFAQRRARSIRGVAGAVRIRKVDAAALRRRYRADR